jgi:uncharacterized protein
MSPQSRTKSRIQTQAPVVAVVFLFAVISQELLELLVCPKCKAPVTLSSTGEELVCNKCHRAYPIRDGIPVMLIEEARVIST